MPVLHRSMRIVFPLLILCLISPAVQGMYKGTAYYPRDYPWLDMWTEPKVLVGRAFLDDVARMRAANVQVARIILQYVEGETVDGDGNVYPDVIDRLQGVFDTLRANGIFAIFTIFDWYFTGGHVIPPDTYRNHIDHLVSHFGNHPAIRAWDVRNEPDHCWWIHGADKDTVLDDVRNAIDYLKPKVATFVYSEDFGHFLNDRKHRYEVLFWDDFDDGDYDDWDVLWGGWQVTGGRLRGEGRIRGGEYGGDGKSFHVTLRMRTVTPGGETWNVGRVLFKYQNDDNYYSLLLHTNGAVELAQKYRGSWHPYLDSASSGLDPLDCHEVTVTVNEVDSQTHIIQAYLDGTQFIFHRATDRLLNFRRLAMEGEASVADFDDIGSGHGPFLDPNNILSGAEVISIHVYKDNPADNAIVSDMLGTIDLHFSRPYILGEFGCNTYHHSESVQSQYYSDVMTRARNGGALAVVSWCFNNYTPDWVQPWEQEYGMYRTDYTLKPAGAVFRDFR